MAQNFDHIQIGRHTDIVIWRPVYSNYGAAQSPDLDCFPSSILFCQTSICMSTVVGSQYGATVGAAESQRAQLHSQGKLIMPRSENRKIWHKSEILKANEHSPRVYKLQIYRVIRKTYHKISWDYLFIVTIYIGKFFRVSWRWEIL
jgi:hypothetical protein